MGQAEIMQVVSENPEQWFKSNYFVKIFDQSSSIICKSLGKLWDAEFLERRIVKQNNNDVYEYRLFKGVEMAQAEIYEILRSNKDTEYSSEQLSELIGISKTAIMRGLRKLEKNIIQMRHGNEIKYRYNPEKVLN